MLDGFLGLPLDDVIALLEESKIPYEVKGTYEKGRDTRVLRVKQTENGVLELLVEYFQTSL